MLPEEHEESNVASQRVAELFAQCAAEYDFVILDSPALLGIADSLTLSSLVDGILMVVQLGKTREARLREAYRQIESVQANLIGVILNTVGKEHTVFYPYYRSKQRNYSVDLFPGKSSSNNPPLGNPVADPSLMRSVLSQNVAASTPAQEFAKPKKSTYPKKAIPKNGASVLDEDSAESVLH
jgi:cellulose biosynthesis protein BcsQ